MSTEWIAPSIAGVLTLITGITVGIIGFRNSRKGALETRAPDVNEAWLEADRARHLMYFWQDLFHLMRGAFKGYARRMEEKDPTHLLTEGAQTVMDVNTTTPDAPA